MPNGNLLVEEIAGLRGELSGLRTSIETYAATAARSRRMMRILAASVIFDVALSVGLAYAVHQSNNASAKATRASSTVVVGCRAGNVSNDIQTKLWRTVLAFPAPADETPEAKVRREEQTARFKDYIATAFAQQDCGKVN